MARGTYIDSALDVWETLLDGKPRTIKEFSHLNISSRHIRRVLNLLKKRKKLQIHYSSSTNEWYCNLKIQKFIGRVKRCASCKQPKNFENDFYNSSFSSDGKQISCKSCQYKYATKWRKTNREHHNALMRRRYRRSKTIAKQRSKDFYWEHREEILKKKKEKYYKSKQVSASKQEA